MRDVSGLILTGTGHGMDLTDQVVTILPGMLLLGPFLAVEHSTKVLP